MIAHASALGGSRPARQERALCGTLAFAIITTAIVGWGGLSAEAVVSVVAYNNTTASGPGFNLTVPTGQTANCVVVVVHTCAVNLTTESVAVTVGGAVATAVTGGYIMHDGIDDDVKLETFYRLGSWASGATIPVSWTWGGSAPSDYVVGAYALKGVSNAAQQPFQDVQTKTGGNGGVRSVTLPSLNTTIDGSIVLWAYVSDNQSDATPTAAPGLSVGPTTAWQVNDTGSAPRIRAESWHGTATNANNSEVLGTSNGNGRVVMVGLSMLPTIPTVTSIVRNGSNPTGAASVTFTVTFSEAVTGVGTDDFGLTTTGGITGASVTGVSADSGLTRTVTVNTGSGSGTIRLDVVDNDSIMNAETNPLGGPGTGLTGNGSFTAGQFYTIDKTPPTVTSIIRNDPDPTNAAWVYFYVTFSEGVTGVGKGDFALTTTGSIAGASVASVSSDNGSPWRMVVVNAGSGDGTIRLDVVDDDSIIDALATPLGGLGTGNGTFTAGEFYTIDKTPPMVTSIVRAGGDPTNAASVNFTVTFSEAVTGVGTDDFVLATSGVTGASVAGVSADSGLTRTVTVNTGNGSGTIRLDVVDDNTILDAVSNPLGGTAEGDGNFTAGQFYTIDKTSPAVFSIVRVGSDPTNAASVTYAVTFSEAVTGVGAADFGLTTTGSITSASITGVTADSGATRTVTVNTGNGSGTIRLDVVDDNTILDSVSNPLGGASLGDDDFAGGQFYTIDKTPPTVLSIVRAESDPANAVSVGFTVTFSEAVTGVGTDDFALTTSGVTGASVTGVSADSGSVRTVAVNTGSGDGTIRLDVVDNDSIVDVVSNPLGGAGAGNDDFTAGEFYTIDKTPPTGTIVIDGGAYATSVNVAVTLDASDIHGVAGMRFSNDNATWSAEEPYAASTSWTLSSGDGVKAVYVQYKDSVGNWTTTTINDDVMLDTTAPIGSVNIDGGAPYAKSGDVILTLNASDSNGVVGMRFSNDNAAWSTGEAYGTSKSWTLAAGDGPKTVYAQYEDTAGNWSSATISDAITLDTVAPTGSVEVNGNAAYTVSADVTLTLSASDATSGMDQMRFSNDDATWSTWEPYVMSKPWTLESGDGTKTVYVQYVDVAGNPSGSFSDTIELDTVAPTVTSVAVFDGRNVDVTFSEPVNGAGALVADNYTVSGPGMGTLALHPNSVVDQSGNVYRLTWATGEMKTGGSVTITVTGVQDLAGNPLGLPDSGTHVDGGVGIAPVVAVTYLHTNDNTPQISGTVVEAGGTPSVEVVVNGHSYTASVTLSSGNSYDWHAAVTDPLPDGTFDVVATATDLAGNTGVDSATDDLYIDPGAPTMVENIIRIGISPTNAASVQFRVVFSKEVNGVDATDFTMHADSIAAASISGVSGGADEYVVTVDTGTGDGTVGIDVVDDDSIRDAAYHRPLGGTGLGNGDFTTGEAFAIDKTRPTVSLSCAAPDPTNSTSIPVVVKFSEDVQGFVQDSIALGNAALSGFTIISASEYHFDMNPLADGLVTADIAANAAQDVAGNGNTAAIQLGRTSDTTPPTASITLDDPTPTGADAVHFSVDFSESVGATFTTANVSVTGALAGTVGVSGTDPNYVVTVTLADSVADGTVGIAIDGNAADRAGNHYAGGSSSACAIYNWRTPYFVTQPLGAEKYVGDSHTLNAVPNCGAGTIAYQWKWDNGLKVVQDGPTAHAWNLIGLNPANVGAYWCEISYDGQTHATDHVMLRVEEHLSIIQQPLGGVAQSGADFTLSVAVTGGYAPLTYQWKKDGLPISNATEANLVLSQLELSDTGSYTVEVADANTDARASNAADLTVSQGLPATGSLSLAVLIAACALLGTATLRRLLSPHKCR